MRSVCRLSMWGCPKGLRKSVGVTVQTQPQHKPVVSVSCVEDQTARTFRAERHGLARLSRDAPMNGSLPADRLLASKVDRATAYIGGEDTRASSPDAGNRPTLWLSSEGPS